MKFLDICYYFNWLLFYNLVVCYTFGSFRYNVYKLYEICLLLVVTVDHQTLEDSTVTIRKRDSMEQTRVSISELDSILLKSVAFP